MPSLVERPAFLVACASPCLRRIVTASSRLPLASTSAFLHSIMPAPVASRSFFTSSALIAIAVAIRQLPKPQLPIPQFLVAFSLGSWELEVGSCLSLVQKKTGAGIPAGASNHFRTALDRGRGRRL